jgi:hypothetical protein
VRTEPTDVGNDSSYCRLSPVGNACALAFSLQPTVSPPDARAEHRGAAASRDDADALQPCGACRLQA